MERSEAETVSMWCPPPWLKPDIVEVRVVFFEEFPLDVEQLTDYHDDNVGETKGLHRYRKKK